MKFDDLIAKAGESPVIEAESLLVGVARPLAIKVQLSRWCKAGKLIQVRRGIYLLSEVYRKKNAYGPFLASLLKKPSYISFEKALEFHGMIPEAVPVYTCLTTKRGAVFNSPAGSFSYRHIKQALFWGYEASTMNGQTGFIAFPEKALLDLIYMRGMKISQAWLRQLRLQDVKKISRDRLSAFAEKFKSAGMRRAAAQILIYIERYDEEAHTL